MDTSVLAALTTAAAPSADATCMDVSGPLRWRLTGGSLLFIAALACWSVYQLRKRAVPRRM